MNPPRFETLCLGLKLDTVKGSDSKYIYNILKQKSYHKELVAKSPPRIEDLIEVVQDIFKIERLTFILRCKQDKFDSHWENWIKFITTFRHDTE